jgi:spore cortex formation protein SpoVR/YcgB (stage V sporulation)
MRNFKDESFIAQYLSPRVMRDFRLFAVLDDDREDKLEVSAIHDDGGFRKLRAILSDQYNLGAREPNVQVWNVDLRGDRSLTLRHTAFRRRALGPTTDEVLRHVARLWGFTVRLERVDEDGKVELVQEIRGETTRPRQPA